MRKRYDESDSTPPEEISESIQSDISNSNQEMVYRDHSKTLLFYLIYLAVNLKDDLHEEGKNYDSTENREKMTEDN